MEQQNINREQEAQQVVDYAMALVLELPKPRRIKAIKRIKEWCERVLAQ